ncbi:MAG: asparaginase [Gemmatimonadetes bacterium]|nr:asparaginase [Gemmatimonadota bacterium]
MQPLRVEASRGPLVESIHPVSVAVVDAEGRLTAQAGDPTLVTFWRSAAKPFQSMPLVADGAASRFGLDDEELALTCASHSSEPAHLAVVDRMLQKIGEPETALACGPHPPLSPEVATAVVRERAVMSPRWSNCSGKHAGMLALAKHHGWPTAGYQRAGHPLQDRLLVEVSRWTEVDPERIHRAVDGCTTVCYGLPLAGMALGYARFGVSADPAARRLWTAMTSRPFMIAGTGRTCTEVMTTMPGEIVAKIGADGIYCAALPRHRLGLALKVHDGDMSASSVALIAVLDQLFGHLGDDASASALLARGLGGDKPIVSTRGEPVGAVRVAGRLAFS